MTYIPDILQGIESASLMLKRAHDILCDLKVDNESLTHPIDLTEIKNMLIFLAKMDAFDINHEHAFSYQNAPEKREILLHGIHHGYATAIYWMAYHFGLSSFFEDKIGYALEKIRE